MKKAGMFPAFFVQWPDLPAEEATEQRLGRFLLVLGRGLLAFRVGEQLLGHLRVVRAVGALLGGTSLAGLAGLLATIVGLCRAR